MQNKLNIQKVADTASYGPVQLFDTYTLAIPPGLDYWFDGNVGRRVLMMEPKDKSFLISFEEGMRCLDLSADSGGGRTIVQSEYRKDGKYLHQKKLYSHDAEKFEDVAFFHMAIPDDDGELYILPGQMLSSPKLRRSDGVEPVLLDILNGIAVCKLKGGGPS